MTFQISLISILSYSLFSCLFRNFKSFIGHNSKEEHRNQRRTRTLFVPLCAFILSLSLSLSLPINSYPNTYQLLFKLLDLLNNSIDLCYVVVGGGGGVCVCVFYFLFLGSSQTRDQPNTHNKHEYLAQARPKHLFNLPKTLNSSGWVGWLGPCSTLHGNFEG